MCGKDLNFEMLQRKHATTGHGDKKGNGFRWRRGTKASRKKENTVVVINERGRDRQGSMEKPNDTLIEINNLVNMFKLCKTTLGLIHNKTELLYLNHATKYDFPKYKNWHRQ